MTSWIDLHQKIVTAQQQGESLPSISQKEYKEAWEDLVRIVYKTNLPNVQWEPITIITNDIGNYDYGTPKRLFLETLIAEFAGVLAARGAGLDYLDREQYSDLLTIVSKCPSLRYSLG